jgi:uncharacterized protein
MASARLQPRRKQTPERTCVICRTKRDKRRLTRIVRQDDGVFVDPTGKQAGRGAYLCDDPACWARATETTILDKALRTRLKAEDYERIRQVKP